jgi:hypothetical protein
MPILTGASSINDNPPGSGCRFSVVESEGDPPVTGCRYAPCSGPVTGKLVNGAGPCTPSMSGGLSSLGIDVLFFYWGFCAGFASSGEFFKPQRGNCQAKVKLSRDDIFELGVIKTRQNPANSPAKAKQKQYS